jgi:hypothetical protein
MDFARFEDEGRWEDYRFGLAISLNEGLRAYTLAVRPLAPTQINNINYRLLH